MEASKHRAGTRRTAAWEGLRKCLGPNVLRSSERRRQTSTPPRPNNINNRAPHYPIMFRVRLYGPKPPLIRMCEEPEGLNMYCVRYQSHRGSKPRENIFRAKRGTKLLRAGHAHLYELIETLQASPCEATNPASAKLRSASELKTRPHRATASTYGGE